MSVRQKVSEELKALVLTTVYFAVWFALLIVLKELLLAEYEIAVGGLSFALVGALVVAKVVLVLEHVPLGPWVHKQAGV